jgi:hypothetical protein
MKKRTFDHRIDPVDETVRFFYGYKPHITHVARWSQRHPTLPTKHTQPMTMEQARAWARRHGLRLPVPPASGEAKAGPPEALKHEGRSPYLPTFFGGVASKEAIDATGGNLG